MIAAQNTGHTSHMEISQRSHLACISQKMSKASVPHIRYALQKLIHIRVDDPNPPQSAMFVKNNNLYPGWTPNFFAGDPGSELLFSGHRLWLTCVRS